MELHPCPRSRRRRHRGLRVLALVTVVLAGWLAAMVTVPSAGVLVALLLVLVPTSPSRPTHRAPVPESAAV